MGNEISTLTDEDLRIQLESYQETIDSVVKQMLSQAEENARKLLKQETSAVPYQEQFNVSHEQLNKSSYQELIEDKLTGFMQVYTGYMADYKTMTTQAKRDVILALAKFDLFGDQTFFRTLRSDSKA